MGATGRLGLMLRRSWSGASVLWGARAPKAGQVACDPVAAPQQVAALAQGCRAILCLAGVTPAAAAGGADWADDRRLALAALATGEATGAHVFLCSSAAIYGRAAGPLREEATPTPAAPYGVSKAAMEAAVLDRAAQTGQGVTILRIGNVAGADAILGGWHPGFTLDTFADGTTPARSYIGPKTLAYVLGALMGAPDLPQILNIASPGAVEMGALLDAAGLAYAPRLASKSAIARVEFATDRVQALVPLPSATAGAIVAEWRADGAGAPA